MTGSLTLRTTGSGSTPALVFMRGSGDTDNYTDIRMYNSAGTLYFERKDNVVGKWVCLMYLDAYGQLFTKGSMNANSGTITW